MKKNYFLTLICVLLLVASKASAWSYNIPAENDVLMQEYGLSLYKYYDFFNGMSSPSDYFSDGAGNRVSGDGCFVLSTDKAAIKLNGFDAFQVQKPVEMGNFYIGIGTGAINLRAGVGKDGLHNYGSGSRFMAISDVKAGQIVVCQWGCTTTRGTVCQPSNALKGGDACTWTDITEEIHEKQKEIWATSEWDYDPEYPGDEEHAVETIVPGTPDAFSYWRAESDGYFVIELQRDIAVQGLQIWLDASAGESVASPTMKVVGVDGAARSIQLTSGESTLGQECTVWYGLEDEPALYLEDTDEVLRVDTIYVKDEDGNPTNEVEEIRITYKQQLSAEDWAEGVAGSNIYNNAPFIVSAEDDTNGDGIVTIHAATVSSTGNFSDIVDYNVSVDQITLNAPYVTLIGLDHTMRQYQLGWNNNTLCGEEYQLKVTVDGEEIDAQIGDTFEAENTIAAKATSAGYEDGVLAEEPVMNQGIDYYRKDAVAAAEERHDWDFVHLTPDQYELIQGTYSDTIAYIRPNAEDETKMDTTFYTRDAFAALVAEGILMQEDGTPWHPVESGWWYDAAKTRATLNVIEGGLDQNANGYGYVEDTYVQLFDRGLSVSCAPNANNASSIFVYNNNDLGCYFMSRPTLTFTRQAAAAGEYVLIYQGAGGSNFTNSRWPSLYPVPHDDLLSVTLQSGGVHVFYIDVYTTDELPTDGVEALRSATTDSKVIYDLQGRRLSAGTLKAGIYIKGGKKIVVK